MPAGEIEGAVVNQFPALFRQPDVVVGTWRAARAQDDGITEAEIRDALLQLDPPWDELLPAEQARIVQLLVERVKIAEDGLEIRLRTDRLAGLVGEFSVGTKAAARSCPSTLSVRVPFAVRKHDGRKLVITPDGETRRARPHVDSALVKAIARAHRCSGRWRARSAPASLSPPRSGISLPRAQTDAAGARDRRGDPRRAPA